MKRTCLLFLMLPLMVILFIMVVKDRGRTYEAMNNEERISFIRQYGWDISDLPIEEEGFTLPKEYDDVYKEYNKLQNAAGMDIVPYMGKDVVRYTYLVKNHKKAQGRQVRANVLVHEGKIIAADVMVVEADGFMHSINKTVYAKDG